MTDRIGFYVVGYKGYYVLSQMLRELNVDAVSHVTVGRDNGVENDYFDEMARLAKECGIAVFERGAEAQEKLPVPALEFAVGWKWLLTGRPGLVVFHDSLLPRYRGFAPLVNCLIAGERRIGVTALRAADKYDAGPIVGQAAIDIDYPITIQDALERICPLYGELALDVYRRFRTAGSLDATEQDHSQASYSPWRDELDYRIPWSESARYVRRFCDAVGAPYRGASTYWRDQCLRILEVDEVQDVEIGDRDKHVGKVLDREEGMPVVICGTGLLQVRRAVFDETAADALSGLPLRTRFTSTPV